MTSQPRSIVIGTAGHIDHGKTTLVRALTGIDADRLPEEKRRGITIDLGFASFDTKLPNQSPMRISFVDVPGHSLFIRNMLAGAGCVSAVMLVVAADEGVMPQTVEHLAICELLGISHGITVITKTDAVDATRLVEMQKSVESFLQGTFLERDHGAVVPVSAASGEGMDALRTALRDLATRLHITTSDALMRMPADRSFVMKGFGTVVTGTLLSGTIREGQTLQLEPGNRAVRVRGLQSHGEPQQTAQPGSRVAVNLSGVDATEVHRGQTLVLPNTLRAVDLIDVEIELLKSAPKLKHRASVHFHALTSETMANVSLYGYEAVQPGSVRLARLKLTEPIVLVPGDRFVIRLPLPAGTIGGGRVLDASPEARLRKAVTLSWLEQIKGSSTEQQIELRVGRRKTTGITLDALSIETGLSIDAVRRLIHPAVRRGSLLFVTDDLLLSREGLVAAASAIMARLQVGQPTAKRSELRSQTSLKAEIFEFAIQSLLREQKVEVSGETVSIYRATRNSSDAESEQLTAVARIYEAAGLASPSVTELAARLKLGEAEIRRRVTILQRNMTIVRMGNDDLFIHSAALQQLAAQITALRGSVMDVGRFKQITGLSRKYAIPLLEYLDRQHITRKKGDERVVL
ncbi:selenocysteine-specific translation elongation factor [Telmatobacter sp. DSM 110680]|uniref:Selenocysteine-specific elongation factor n=1 Tax=Telmatobacter sp. DSM 110680 TaxID=3036704 RepID=A0AAU7DMZ8_9BACT